VWASSLPGFLAAGVLCLVAVASLRLLKGRSGPVALPAPSAAG